MITKDTFLVSFNIQGEGFCEPFLVTYRTEELNPYLRYPRQTLNPNHLHVHFTKQIIRELMKMPYYDIEILDFIRVPQLTPYIIMNKVRYIAYYIYFSYICIREIKI